MSSFKRGDNLEVEWDDICSENGWCHDSRAGMEMIRIRTVGMFLKRDKKAITLAMSMDSTSDRKTTDRITIGNANVRKIRKLR